MSSHTEAAAGGAAAGGQSKFTTLLHVPADLLERLLLTTLQNAAASAALACAYARGRDNRHYADQLERLATLDRTEDEVHVIWG